MSGTVRRSICQVQYSPDDTQGMRFLDFAPFHPGCGTVGSIIAMAYPHSLILKFSLLNDVALSCGAV